MAKRMHLRYNNAFEEQALGYALLHPLSTDRLHPGVCGYFDADGDWKTIVDIPKIKDTYGKRKSWFIPLEEDLAPVPRGPPVRWEPKVSSDMTYEKQTADVSAKSLPLARKKLTYRRASEMGIGQTFDKFHFKREDKSDFGAVLVAEAPVHLDYFPDDVLFYHWLKQNIPTFIAQYPELVESGIPLWIVTKIYHTSKCSIACWDGDQQEVSLDFGLTVDVPPAAGTNVSATPGTEKVSVKTTGPGWAHYGITELIGSTTTHPVRPHLRQF